MKTRLASLFIVLLLSSCSSDKFEGSWVCVSQHSESVMLRITHKSDYYFVEATLQGVYLPYPFDGKYVLSEDKTTLTCICDPDFCIMYNSDADILFEPNQFGYFQRYYY